ncbi:MAG: M1 family metallopeptidase [Flavobacterium sp.]|uniref:M1 family metallopeptidase n=1 Tax=Flavobacterium sp. TaxID=239 RepID=UPI0022CB22FD|nr:M1 family metallopeptidase [Flavobacterium sp.]MCZ8197655.1 M1 family metallopeptidase [Flavobacterium sp.]
MRYLIFFLFSICSIAQQTSKVDFLECNATIVPKAESKSVSGKVLYTFKVKSSIDTIRIDAKNMGFSEVIVNGKKVNFKNNKKELLLFEGFKIGKNKVAFDYECKPKQAFYFVGEGDNLQIWTQGQGKYTSYWLPSFDDVNEKVIFNLNINFNKDFEVLSNGKFMKSSINTNLKVWNYQMQKPMSSYLLMVAIGKFVKHESQSKSGIPLEFYLDANDSDKFEPTYRYSKQIFDFFEKKIGVKYPWKIYRQVPVRDFLYAGMENTSATIFAQDFVVDSIGFNDRNYVWVNAHELAHQWFGNLITAKSGKHHWLQEGFAKYYEMLAEKEVFGDDYFYYKLYKNANAIKNASKTDTIPVMNEKASSLSFYEKGAWALHVIRETIGEEKFDKAVKTYLKKYKFKNVETDNFLAEIKKVSNFDVENFKKKWLLDWRYQSDDINRLLNKNEFIKQLVEIQKQSNKPFSEKKDMFLQIMNSNVYYPIKVEILYQISSVSFEYKKRLIEIAMQCKSIEVRQAVAETLNNIPIDFKKEYETLLNDESYNTKEIAYVNLWNNFPNEQSKYLKIAKDWKGNNDRSLRILYLMYAQLSKEIYSETKFSLYNELINYTSSKFESSIRQNAFEAALIVNPHDEIVLKNLINGTIHFRWQFSKYSKDKIRELIKDEKNKKLFVSFLTNLDEKEQTVLKKIL